MQHPLPDLGEWPSLEWEQWKDTAETLHMYMQIVGKTRLALTPLQNYWWNIPLYLTARGLSTSAMPADGGRLLDIEFDFVSHELVCRTSDGEIRKIPLRPVPVAEFFEEFTRTLSSLGVSVKIHPMPVEVANPIRCDLDTVVLRKLKEEDGPSVRLKIGSVFKQRFRTACPRTAPGRPDLPLLTT
jgi:hypothetical protein